jgi:2-haloacid dehalogenase
MNFDGVRLLSFDCYGTLVDWESGILAAVRAPFSRLSKPPSDEEILSVFGKIEQQEERPPFKHYRVVLRNVMEGMAGRFGLRLQRNEEDLLADSLPSWPLFDDTNEALAKLATRFQLAVLSNVDDDLFEGTQQHLTSELRYVVTAQRVRSYKPGHAHFERLMALAGYDKSHIVHCGQSAYHDVAPARALGIRSVRVLRRGFGATVPADDVADLTVSSMAELAEIAAS